MLVTDCGQLQIPSIASIGTVRAMPLTRVACTASHARGRTGRNYTRQMTRADLFGESSFHLQAAEHSHVACDPRFLFASHGFRDTTDSSEESSHRLSFVFRLLIFVAWHFKIWRKGIQILYLLALLLMYGI